VGRNDKPLKKSIESWLSYYTQRSFRVGFFVFVYFTDKGLPVWIIYLFYPVVKDVVGSSSENPFCSFVKSFMVS